MTGPIMKRFVKPERVSSPVDPCLPRTQANNDGAIRIYTTGGVFKRIYTIAARSRYHRCSFAIHTRRGEELL